jgi:hypothetical protein
MLEIYHDSCMPIHYTLFLIGEDDYSQDRFPAIHQCVPYRLARIYLFLALLSLCLSHLFRVNPFSVQTLFAFLSLCLSHLFHGNPFSSKPKLYCSLFVFLMFPSQSLQFQNLICLALSLSFSSFPCQSLQFQNLIYRSQYGTLPWL